MSHERLIKFPLCYHWLSHFCYVIVTAVKEAHCARLRQWLITLPSIYCPLHTSILAQNCVHIYKKKNKCAYRNSSFSCTRPCALCLLLHCKNRTQWFLSKAAFTWAASVSEWKSRLSHSFYWSVQASWIISELVGFRTDTEPLLKHCLLSPTLTSIIHHPAGTSHFSLSDCALPQRQVKSVIVSSQASMMDD